MWVTIWLPFVAKKVFFPITHSPTGVAISSVLICLRTIFFSLYSLPTKHPHLISLICSTVEQLRISSQLSRFVQLPPDIHSGTTLLLSIRQIRRPHLSSNLCPCIQYTHSHSDYSLQPGTPNTPQPSSTSHRSHAVKILHRLSCIMAINTCQEILILSRFNDFAYVFENILYI